MLTEAGGAGDQAAADAVWHAWLAHPDDEQWELLVSWRGRHQATEDACAAAVADGGAAVARFCASHQIAPADPVRRAVFFLLTGQAAQLRAADPGGSQLALGYAAAADAEKARMRAAMAAAGGLDLVQVMTRGDPSLRLAALTPEEIRYLTSQLAARQDWAGLWQLTAGLPVLDAVTALRQFGDGWQPADPGERALFRLLSSADPARLARAAAALGSARAPGSAVSSTRISIPGMHPYAGAALTTDGQQLALVASYTPHTSQFYIVVAGLPGAREAATAPTGLERYPVAAVPRSFAFAGDTLIVKNPGTRPGSGPAGLLARYAGGRVQPLPRLATGDYSPDIFLVAPWYPRAGFVVLGREHLGFYTGSGDLITTAPLHLETWLTHSRIPSAIAAGPAGMLAVAGDAGLAVFDGRDGHDSGPVATATLPEGWQDLCFTGADRIITVSIRMGHPSDPHAVQLWQLDGTRLELIAARQMGSGFRDPALIPGPGGGVIAAWSAGGLRFLDPGTLADAAPPKGVSRTAVRLLNSPGLDRCVLVGHEFIEVHDGAHPVAAVADRAPGQWVPQDLALVSGAMRSTRAGSPTRPLLELLAALLELRFDADVSLGAAARPSGREDDVALRPGSTVPQAPVQVVAGGEPRQRVAALTGEEIRYLAGHFAARRDWAALWQLTASLPFVDALSAMREFSDGWQPSDAPSQALFQALAHAAGRADPAALARARAALAAIRPDGAPRSRRISVPDLSTPDFVSAYGALTADGERMAIAIRAGVGQKEYDIAIVGLPGSAAPGEVARYRATGEAIGLTFASDRLLVRYLQVTGPRNSPDSYSFHLAGCAAGQVTTMPQTGDPHDPLFSEVVPWYAQPGGFIGCGSEQLRFYTTTSSEHPVAIAPTHGDSWKRRPRGGKYVAAEPGGLLAVASHGGLAVFDTRNPMQAGPVATAQLAAQEIDVRFCGPGRIITVSQDRDRQVRNDDNAVQLWQFDGTRLEEIAIRMANALDPAVIPGQDLIAARELGGRLRFLDAGTLADATPHEGMSGEANGLWNSPGLDRCVLLGGMRSEGAGFIEVHDSPHPAAAIADRAPSQWAPQDLAVVSSGMDGIRAGMPGWELLDLLHTCLEHRFGQ